jgi:hypothetical protein
MRITLISILLAAACSSSSSAPNSAALTKACNDLATAYCNKLSTCSGGVSVTRDFGDLPTCVQREALSCTLGGEASKTGSSPANVESCVAAYPSYSCEDFFNSNEPAACLVNGPIALNAPCAFAGQCASSYCDNNKTSTCGTCGDAPAAGASCHNSGCARGQSCSARTQTCLVLAKVGMSCDNDTAPCEFGLSCVKTVSTAALGTCVAQTQEANQACGGNDGQCDNSKGLSCQGATPTTRTCVPAPLAGDGQACGDLTTGTVACTQGNCYNAAGTIALSTDVGTCKTDAADGQPCDLDAGPSCLTPARCVVTGGGSSGVCTVPSGTICE